MKVSGKQKIEILHDTCADWTSARVVASALVRAGVSDATASAYIYKCTRSKMLLVDGSGPDRKVKMALMRRLLPNESQVRLHVAGLTRGCWRSISGIAHTLGRLGIEYEHALAIVHRLIDDGFLRKCDHQEVTLAEEGA